jgi:hypothetical protein
MAKILIQTQDYENYAWVDGELQTGPDAYWKAKGGQDYFITNFTGNEEQATATVMAMRDDIEVANDAFVSTIIGWTIVSDDYMTEFEKSQLEYEGKIRFPAKVLEMV